MWELAARVLMNTDGHIYLCRNKLWILCRVLRPRAIMFLGGRNRLWFNESQFASALKSDGHRVFFTESE